MLGLLVLAGALLRARTVPWWAPALLITFILIEVLLVDIDIAETIGFVVLTVGLGCLGWHALSSPLAEATSRR